MFEKLKPREVWRTGASHSEHGDDRNFVLLLHSSRNALITDEEGFMQVALMNFVFQISCKLKLLCMRADM